jgi:hypothetical protein
MARYSQDRDTGPILEAAREWAIRCLVENGAILGTGSLWTSENFALLDRFFVQQPDAGEGDFYEKLEGQMSGAPPDAPKLMAELLWVLFLFPSNTGPRAKRAGIAQAWSYSGETLDGDLRLLSDAVLLGIGSAGTAFNTMRWAELIYAITLFAELKRKPAAERSELLADYDRFSKWLETMPRDGDRQLRHMLRYLLFPDRVERMSSNADRRRVLEGFGVATPREMKAWTDRQFDDALLTLRQRMERELGRSDLDFYCAPLAEQWRDDDAQPPQPVTSFDLGYSELREAFVRVYPGFQSFQSDRRYRADERDYKDELVAAFAQLVGQPLARSDYSAAGEAAIALLTRPLRQAEGKPQNIVGWRYVDVLRQLPADQRAAFGQELASLVDEATPLQPRVDRFVAALGRLAGAAQRVLPAAQRSIAGLYLALAHPDKHTFLKTREMQRALRKLDPTFQWNSDRLTGRDVERVEQLAERVFRRLESEGWSPKDLLDAQGFLWAATATAGQVAEADEEETSEHVPAAVPSVPARAVNKILFGPPGTGKTYALQKLLAEEYGAVAGLAAETALGPTSASAPAGRFAFITFHQSFSYEDFMEGITPLLDEASGSLRYGIKQGVFLRLCERARKDPSRSYAMVIDEINRGNVSKVFGELITLIEPDKRAGCANELSLTLPYSGATFSVPANVDVIGTMNTADRSLTGLDIALRRRFEFVEMPPRPDLLQGVAVEGIDVAMLLTVMNRRIEALLDRDHRLGHAYFMGLSDDPTLARLASIFRGQIVPLLQEYFFEDWERIRWILNDQNKPEGFRFVVAPRHDASSMFGGSSDVAVQSKLWELDEDAFGRRESYVGVIGV